MRSKKTKKSFLSKRPWFYGGVILVLVLAGVAAYALIHSSNKPGEATTQSPSTSKIDYSPATKADNAPNETRKGSSNPSSTLNNYQSPPNTGSFNVTITRAGVDSANQTLQVAAIVNGITSGTCTLNVHQDGQSTISRSEAITFQVNTYVCPVINIPLSQFPNRNGWNVSMTVESGGKTVTADWAKNPVSLG